MLRVPMDTPLRLLLLPGLDGIGALFEPFVRALSAEIAPQVVRYPADQALDYDALEAIAAQHIPARGFSEAGEADGEPAAVSGRKAHEALMSLYGRWDLELADKVSARFPNGPPWDADFLEWLGREYTGLLRRHRRALRDVR
jgi:hypothetical protein